MKRLAIILLLACITFGFAPPSWAAPKVNMSLEPANGGRMKLGTSGITTLYVDLSNQGPEVKGELIVQVTNGGLDYSLPVTLPAGGRKRVPVHIFVPNGATAEVRFVAEGKAVASKDFAPTQLPPMVPLVGILSGDEQGIPALGLIQDGAQTARLTAETFPDRSALLANYDVIAISRFDTSSLRPEQLRALDAWVGQGGSLLLAGGPEWRRTLAPLPPALVPVTVTEVRSISLSSLEGMGRKPLAGQGPVSVGQVQRGTSLLAAESVPLVVTAPIGAGKVTYLAFDPSLDPVASWPGLGTLLSRLLQTDPRGLEGGPHTWRIQQALEQMPDLGLPSGWTVMALLCGYLLLIGPINYLVLKRLDRREWSWVTIPAISLLLVGGVYVGGQGRFRGPLSHVITVTDLSGGSAASMSTYVGLYAPDRTRISLSLTEASPMVIPVSLRSFQGGGSTTVMLSETPRVQFERTEGYRMQDFSLQRDLPLSGGLELVEVKMTDGRLEGRVANRLDRPVRDLIIRASQSQANIAQLGPGEVSEPFSITTWNTMLEPRIDEPWNGVQDDLRPRLIRASIMEQVAQRQPFSVVVLGMVDEPLAETGVSMIGRVRQGGNLVYSVHPIPNLTAGGTTAEIPFGAVVGVPDQPQGLKPIPGGFLLPGGTHTFSIVVPPLDAKKVTDFQIEVASGVTAAVLNQVAAQWEPIVGQRQSLRNWQEYVGADGVLQVRYELVDMAEVTLPTIGVKGGVR